MRNPLPSGLRRDRVVAVGGAAGLAVACAVLVVAVYRLAVWTVPGRLLDGHALRGALASRTRVTDVVSGILDVVSVASLAGAAAVIAVIALLRLRRAVGLAALSVLVLSNVATQVLKQLVLDRPDLGLTERTPSTLNSMPSGHATVAFSVAVALVIVLPARVRSSAATLGAAYAALTAAATMSSGWHRPSDSVVAFLVVGACVALVALVVLLAEDRATEPETWSARDRRTGRRLLVAGGGLLLAGAVLAVVAELVGLRPGGTFVDALAYLAGLLVVAGSSALVMAAVLALVPALTFVAADGDPVPGPGSEPTEPTEPTGRSGGSGPLTPDQPSKPGEAGGR